MAASDSTSLMDADLDSLLRNPMFLAKLDWALDRHQRMIDMAVERGLMRSDERELPPALTVAWLLGGFDKAVMAMDLVEGYQKRRADRDGEPLREIIRSAGVAMKNALVMLPRNNHRKAILEATENILNHAEMLAPDEEGLSDWTEERKRVAAM